MKREAARINLDPIIGFTSSQLFVTVKLVHLFGAHHDEFRNKENKSI